MKYLVLIVVLLGFACGSEEEEVSLQDLEFDDGELLAVARQTANTLDPNLLIGNVVAALSSLNGTDLTSLLGPLLGLGGVGAGLPLLGGLAAPVAGIKGAIAAIVNIIAGIIMVPVGIANQILALVGLVFLILFLIEGGDFKSLVGGQEQGYSRSSTSSWIPSFDYDLVNNPIVESVSEMFFQAMEKYDQ